jgi:hypothetical protein
MSRRPLSQATKADAFSEQVWLDSPRKASAILRCDQLLALLINSAPLIRTGRISDEIVCMCCAGRSGHTFPWRLLHAPGARARRGRHWRAWRRWHRRTRLGRKGRWNSRWRRDRRCRRRRGRRIDRASAASAAILLLSSRPSPASVRQPARSSNNPFCRRGGKATSRRRGADKETCAHAPEKPETCFGDKLARGVCNEDLFNLHAPELNAGVAVRRRHTPLGGSP